MTELTVNGIDEMGDACENCPSRDECINGAIAVTIMKTSGPVEDSLLDLRLFQNPEIMQMFSAEAMHQGLTDDESLLYMRAAMEELYRIEMEDRGEGLSWAEERIKMHNEWVDAE